MSSWVGSGDKKPKCGLWGEDDGREGGEGGRGAVSQIHSCTQGKPVCGGQGACVKERVCVEGRVCVKERVCVEGRVCVKERVQWCEV